MPLQSWGHVQYWEFSDTVAAPITTAAAAGYPQWQASVTVGSLFGPLQDWLERAWGWSLWWYRAMRRLARLRDQDVELVARMMDVLATPGYRAAQQAVRNTAVTVHFNRKEVWAPYSRAIKASPGRAENIFRHIRACELTREFCPSTLTNPQVNLAVELAYHDFALRGR